MGTIPSQARVVIIGGGAVGRLFALSSRQGRLDGLRAARKNELTAGSTWHAAGNVPTFSSSWSIMNMQRYSAQLYRGLAQGGRLPDELSRHRIGAARHSKERLQEFKKVVGMGRYQGMDLDILSPNEIVALPFVETHELSGALYDPERRRHRSGAAYPGAGKGRARHGRDDPALLPGDRRAGARTASGSFPRRRAKSAANMSSMPPATTPARSANGLAATCR